MCCCPQVVECQSSDCSGCAQGNSSLTVRRACDGRGPAEGCACDGHECAATRLGPVAREKSNPLSKAIVTTAFQPAGVASLPPAGASPCVAQNTPTPPLSKCRPHLLLGHLV